MVKLRQNTFTKGKELWEIYGCSSFPKCRFIMNIKDEGEKNDKTNYERHILSKSKIRTGN